jgi:hypothetical protein
LVLPGGVLKAFSKVVQELFLNFGHIVDGRVKVVQKLSHVPDLSCHFRSFDEGEGKGCFCDWGLEACVELVHAEVAL